MEDYNVIKNEKQLKKKLTNLCAKITYISKVKQAIDFFDSNEWKKLSDEKNTNRYNLAAVFLSQVIGENNFMLYNNGKILFDKSDIYQTMSASDLEALKYVDTFKNCEYTSKSSNLVAKSELVVNTGTIQTPTFIMKNIGSAAVIKNDPDEQQDDIELLI